MLWSPLLGFGQALLDSTPTIDAVIAVRGNDILKYVDPLIGSTNGGHVFAGAVSQSTSSDFPLVLILPVITVWYVSRVLDNI